MDKKKATQLINILTQYSILIVMEQTKSIMQSTAVIGYGNKKKKEEEIKKEQENIDAKEKMFIKSLAEVFNTDENDLQKLIEGNLPEMNETNEMFKRMYESRRRSFDYVINNAKERNDSSKKEKIVKNEECPYKTIELEEYVPLQMSAFICPKGIIYDFSEHGFFHHDTFAQWYMEQNGLLTDFAESGISYSKDYMVIKQGFISISKMSMGTGRDIYVYYDSEALKKNNEQRQLLQKIIKRCRWQGEKNLLNEEGLVQCIYERNI